MKSKDLRKRSSGEELWLWRKHKGFLTTEAAEKLGVGRTTYWKYERDLPSPQSSPHYRLWGPPGIPLLLALARRRAGWGLRRTAGRVGCSHVVLLRREAAGDPELRAWWVKQGWTFP